MRYINVVVSTGLAGIERTSADRVDAEMMELWMREQALLRIPFVYQVVKQSGVDRFTEDVRIVSTDRFLGERM